MATAESVKAKLQGLIDLANTTTGKTDTDLTAAVNALIAGFGQGGSPGGTGGIYMAKITPASDIGELRVTHNLGTTDILFAGLWAETLGDIVPGGAYGMMKTWFKTDIKNVRGGYGWDVQVTWDVNNNRGGSPGQPNSTAYWCEAIDENTWSFERPGSASAKYLAGVTYTVIIMAASAFSVTEV